MPKDSTLHFDGVEREAEYRQRRTTTGPAPAVPHIIYVTLNYLIQSNLNIFNRLYEYTQL